MRITLEYKDVPSAVAAMRNTFNMAWPPGDQNVKLLAFVFDDARQAESILDYAVYELSVHPSDRKLVSCKITP